MTDPRVKTKKEEKTEPTALAEVLLQASLTHAVENDMKFGEVMGHIELCKLELFKRQTLAAAQNELQQEGDGTAAVEPSPESEEAPS